MLVLLKFVNSKKYAESSWKWEKFSSKCLVESWCCWKSPNLASEIFSAKSTKSCGNELDLNQVSSVAQDYARECELPAKVWSAWKCVRWSFFGRAQVLGVMRVWAWTKVRKQCERTIQREEAYFEKTKCSAWQRRENEYLFRENKALGETSCVRKYGRYQALGVRE